MLFKLEMHIKDYILLSLKKIINLRAGVSQ